LLRKAGYYFEAQIAGEKKTSDCNIPKKCCVNNFMSQKPVALPSAFVLFVVVTLYFLCSLSYTVVGVCSMDM